jgi:soluble lytic murein transglycosylase-like protein
MQIYTYCICKQEDVSYPLIVAMIEHESGYKFDEAGDGGESLGYMQISEKWHKDRMKELECNNLLNPYQNVRVGISLMKDLIEKYGTIQDALTVYNYGETGARRYLWSNGIYVYDYNKSIMSRMNEIEEELQQQG